MGIISSDEEPCWSDVYNLQTNKVMLELKINKLEAENELLREENLEEQKQYTEMVSANVQKIRQLKQCLQEIKAIAERGFNNSQCNCGLRADIDQIIQKITKAESEG